MADDRHSAMLAELASMSLALARDLQNRALEAASAEDAVKLATAFHRVARGLRQTLALELKVVRFKDELAREAAAAQAGPQASAAGEAADAFGGVRWRRREAIAGEVERLIFSETEGEESWDEETADAQFQRLQGWLEAAAERPDFLTEDVDEQIIAACAACGVDAGRLYTFRPPAADEAADCAPTPAATGPDSS